MRELPERADLHGDHWRPSQSATAEGPKRAAGHAAVSLPHRAIGKGLQHPWAQTSRCVLEAPADNYVEEQDTGLDAGRAAAFSALRPRLRRHMQGARR